MQQVKSKRIPGNVVGRFYTTEECDGCAYCACVAPEHFEYEKNLNKYYVARQPLTPEEQDVVMEAMEDCPLDAIKADESGNGRHRDSRLE